MTAFTGARGPISFGVHAGLQHTDTTTLRALWRHIEALGFDWISIWDHFYAANDDSPDCLEAVSMHAALACDTARVRCGSLVYSAGYRHPAVLANAICTIDQLSGGRAELGLGAGWSKIEYDAYGIAFGSPKERLDLLEESARCVRGLLREPSVTFRGEHFTLTDAQCEPKPVQPALPIWIGGQGEKRLLRIVADYADGWNIAFVGPEVFAAKSAVLQRHCDDAGRDFGEIAQSVNVGLAFDDASLRAQFGATAEVVRPGVLTGSDAQIEDRIGAYVEAGADQINIAVRAPFDPSSLTRLATLVELTPR